MTTAVDRSERSSKDALVAVLMEAGTVFRGNECKCIFHDDKHASAGIYEDPKGVMRYKCHSCDAAGDIFDMRARIEGRDPKDVLPRPEKPPRITTAPRAAGRSYSSLDEIAQHAGGRPEAIYRYTSDFAVIRTIGPDGNKSFKQVHHDDDSWVWGAPEKPWALYNVESIGTTEGPLLVVEGEGCVEALREIGLVAVTSCCGAGKAVYSDWSPLAGRECILWPDNDPPGMNHMRDVAVVLSRLSPVPRILQLDVRALSLPTKGDCVNLLALAPDEPGEVKRRAILELCREAAPVSPMPEWTPAIIETPETKPVEWGEPEPLPEGRAAVKPFPCAMLPDVFRPWIEDIAERLQCPPDFPAVGAMVALSSVLGRQVGIHPKRYDDWIVIPNLWGAAVGRPGIMKSPALSEVLRPLHRLESETAKRHETESRQYETSLEISRAKDKVLKRRLEEAMQDEDEVEAERLAASLGQCGDAPQQHRYLVNDATVEKLGIILQGNPQQFCFIVMSCRGFSETWSDPGTRVTAHSIWKGGPDWAAIHMTVSDAEQSTCPPSVSASWDLFNPAP